MKLPVQPDSDGEVHRVLQDLEAGKPVVLAAVAEPVRPGTLRRSIPLPDEPGLVRMAAGLDYLLRARRGALRRRSNTG